MTGTGFIVVGVILMVVSTIGFVVLEKLFQIKKKRIREGVYQLYD